jgi:hypothetical protein
LSGWIRRKINTIEISACLVTFEILSESQTEEALRGMKLAKTASVTRYSLFRLNFITQIGQFKKSILVV